MLCWKNTVFVDRMHHNGYPALYFVLTTRLCSYSSS